MAGRASALANGPDERGVVLGGQRVCKYNQTAEEDRDLVRLRGTDGVRTVAEFHGPVTVHQHKPGLAIPRTPQRIEVLNMVSGRVIDELRVADRAPDRATVTAR